MVGRNNVKTGLLVLVKVAKKLVCIEDFAPNLLVLQLASYKTGEQILSLTHLPDPKSYFALLASLFFMRVYLFAINCKGNLNKKTRVTLIWSLLIFLLHVDGVHHATKKNWIIFSVLMSFLILRHNMVRPHRATSKPIKHSIAHLCAIVREFSVRDLI